LFTNFNLLRFQKPKCKISNQVNFFCFTFDVLTILLEQVDDYLKFPRSLIQPNQTTKAKLNLSKSLIHLSSLVLFVNNILNIPIPIFNLNTYLAKTFFLWYEVLLKYIFYSKNLINSKSIKVNQSNLCIQPMRDTFWDSPSPLVWQKWNIKNTPTGRDPGTGRGTFSRNYKMMF